MHSNYSFKALKMSNTKMDDGNTDELHAIRRDVWHENDDLH